MRKITLIAAIGKELELGYNNDLIWKIPEDLKFFRENTMGKAIVMGMNTYNSLPKLLPGRRHIVLTHRDICLDSSVMVVHSLDELLEYIDLLDEEVMIIGGATIYKLMIDYADKMLLTEIDGTSKADVYFPGFSLCEWNREIISNYQYNDIEYKHVKYTRKKVCR